MSEKLRSQHLSRKAILYVRQSSAYQVSHNLESQKLQYAMRERLTQLGWREIEVVDEDLGRSAAGLVTRSGFERMVAEVCLGKVGAVAAREVSRFARNSREWQQLVEVIEHLRTRNDSSNVGPGTCRCTADANRIPSAEDQLLQGRPQRRACAGLQGQCGGRGEGRCRPDGRRFCVRQNSRPASCAR